MEYQNQALINFLTTVVFASHLSNPIIFEPVDRKQQGYLTNIIALGSTGTGKSSLLNKIVSILNGNKIQQDFFASRNSL